MTTAGHDLAELLGGEIVARRPLDFGTHPKELVTVRLARGEARVLCKYAGAGSHLRGGHRAGVGYEIEVYRRVLLPLGPVGGELFVAARDRPPLLALWYLGDGVPVSRFDDHGLIVAAARWIARLHAVTEQRALAGEYEFLRIHTARYFAGWAERTITLARPLRRRFPWLAGLCRSLDSVADELVSQPRCVIHGEYYPRNVLAQGNAIHPLDWESAALSAGELDLASLVEGWDDVASDAIAGEYRRARWPAGAPRDFGRRLSAARLYWQLRWLGDRMEWALHPAMRYRFTELHRLGSELGLVA